MNDEEMEISRSTPGYRFDVAATPAPANDAAEAAVDAPADAARFVAEAIDDNEHPVVMFALEWCEFCWSVRKLFARLGIKYRSIDLDSVEYQEDNFGGAIRVALEAAIGAKTIPQIFIAGRHIGGATEMFDAWKDGSAQELLASSGVSFDADSEIDPYSFLPGWLQSR